MTWTIPNMLTVARLFAAPAVALAFAILARPLADWVAFFLFVGASLTDFLDGWLARRWNQLSGFGKMLDPIADKAMVIIALFTLAAIHGPNPWLLAPAAIILLREVAVSGLREYLGAVKLDVTQLAKWKTTAQMIAIAMLLLGGPLLEIGIAMLWLAATLTAITGWDYFSKGLRHMREREAA